MYESVFLQTKVHYVNLQLKEEKVVNFKLKIYNDNLKTEFKGYVQRIDSANNDTFSIICEDAMYLTRKPIKPKEFIKPQFKI